MNIATLIGALAATASTISFVPQAVKIVRTRDTEGISAGMYAITVAGFALWTCYGAMLGSWPLVGSNGLCLALSGFILLMTILPARQKNEVAETVGEAVQDIAQPIVGHGEAADAALPSARP
jgi:MtN3 and saliva related transmembrane protein